MKTFNLVAVLVFAVNAFAADPLTERLQRGLFEEEANHNLDAAIKEYQSVVSQSDEQRRVIATALFRLGECYRKLGRTNEAATFYQRIARDFSEQEQLVRLSQNMTPPAVAASGPESLRSVENLLMQLRAQHAEQKARYDTLSSLPREKLLQAMPLAINDASLKELIAQSNSTEQKLANLKAGPFGDTHPDVVQTREVSKVIQKQIDDRLAGLLTGLKLQADGTASQIKSLEGELEKVKRGVAPAGGNSTAMTQAESEELARVKTLAQNSPDLLNLAELQEAAGKGRYSVVEFLLSRGLNPSDPVSGSSPIVMAARGGHLRIVQLLLDKGVTTEDSGQALLSACQYGFKSVAEVLIARGADANFRSRLNLSPLHFAVFGGQTTLVDLLLKRGAEVNALSTPGNKPSGWHDWTGQGATPLHLAVDRGYAILTAQLIAAGAKANATNAEGRTPLHVAAMYGNTNLCALLLDHGANPNAQTTSGETPLGDAIVVPVRPTDTLGLLLRRGADVDLPGYSSPDYGLGAPVFLALGRNSPEVMSALLVAKPHLEIKSRDRFTPLLEAVRNNRDALAILLLEAGADPNGRYDDFGQTPLHLAVRGRTNLVASLLKHGAKPNVVTRQGDTPLSIALSLTTRKVTSGNSVPVAQLPGFPSNEPTITRAQAAEYQMIVELLRRHGTDEFLQRRGFISAVRGPQQRVNIFSKGTNDLNRYTLMEFLAAVYENTGSELPFPDFGKVVIYRLEGKTEKPLLVNVARLMATTNCTGDLPLEWGDNVEIPMADHPVNATWYGVAATEYGGADPQSATLSSCLQRTVRFSAGGTNVAIPLGVWILDTRTGHSAKVRQPLFRLSAVLLRDNRFRNLLRSSSDLSRVTVTRTDPQTKETKKMTFDLNAVALPDMSYSGNPPPIPWQQDLWLRDGDVIEVPEKP